MGRRKDKRTAIFRTVILFVIIFIVGAFALVRMSENSGDADLRETLAQCLTDNDVVMYGAYWCPHCANQKREFGNAFDSVTYVECATPGNPQAMNDECKDAGIKGYPTWVFPDGTRLSGERALTELADVAGCPWGDEEVEEEAEDELISPAPVVDDEEGAEGDEEQIIDPEQTL